MAACGRFVRNFVRLKHEFGVQAHHIYGDASGLGKPMIDRLGEVGWPINPTFNNSPAQFDSHYANYATECWLELCTGIKEGRLIIPNDVEFRAQLMNRRYDPGDSKGRLKIESKEDMKKSTRDGGAVPCSPDRAEAVAGAALQNRLVKPVVMDWKPKSLFAMDDELEVPESVIAGRWAGA